MATVDKASVRAGIRWIADFAAQVAHNPSAVTTLAPYVRHPMLSSWDAGEPWWNWGAIQYLERNLPSSGNAFEWGSGASTLWLTSHGLQVTAIESEAAWAEKVAERCPTAKVLHMPGHATGTLRLEEPWVGDSQTPYFDDYVAAIDDAAPESLDVVVIDGVCRVDCARHVAPKLKPTGIVVLDDTHWDFIRPAGEAFAGWQTISKSGFKRRCATVFETSFFHPPTP